MADLFQAFYTQFILRDLLGKVAPGALLLLAVSLTEISFSTAIEHISEASREVWVVTTVVAWVVGLSLQGFGEILGLVKYHMKLEDTTNWQRMQADFHAKATPSQEKHNERFVVIKEASGNAAVAIGLSIVIACALKLDATTLGLSSVYVALGFMAVILLCGLTKMHRMNLERGHNYIDAVAGPSRFPRKRRRRIAVRCS